MSDTATPVVESSSQKIANVEVSKPFVSVKPYDDDMLEAYENEATEEVAEAKAPEAKVEEEAPELEPEKSADEADEKESEPEVKKDPEVELGDQVAKVQVNGKEVEVKVKDALNAYAKQEEFNRNMDRRITAISKREKAWATDQTKLKTNIGKVIEVAQNGDFVSGIRALAKLAAGDSGLDVVEFEKQYFAQLDKVREVFGSMTKEQQEAYFAKRALAEAKEEAEKLKGEKEATEETSKLSQSIEATQRELGLSEADFWGAFQQIVDAGVGEGKAFASDKDIQIQDVRAFVLESRQEEKVLQAAEKFGIDDESIWDEIGEVVKGRYDLTVEDISTIIEKAGIGKFADPKTVENLNRKAGKSNARFNQASSTKKDDAVDGYDEETLNELYKHQPKQYQRVQR